MNSNIFLIATGFTTMLKRHVHEKIDGHPLWGAQYLLTNLEAVIDTYRDFIRAGVDIVITHTYQASIEGFMSNLGLNEADSYNLIKKSVDVCRKAIEIEKQHGTINENKRILIAGSVGPFGAHLSDGSEYSGNYLNTYKIEDICKWHRTKLQVLIEGGVEIISFETIPGLEEAEMLVTLIKEFPHIKCWLAFSCKDDCRTSRGENFKDAVIKLWSINPDQLLAVGANCIGTELATKLLDSVKNENIPKIVYPNIIESWDPTSRTWVKQQRTESTSMLVEKWCRMGVRYIGACCGSSLESRIEMRNVIDQINSTNNCK